MEVVHSAPETFSRSVKKKNLLPLSQLLEDTRKSGNVPHHLLETSKTTFSNVCFLNIRPVAFYQATNITGLMKLIDFCYFILLYNLFLYVYLLGVFAKLKSNGVVQAEPLELHFSGFEVGKDYRKNLVGFSLLAKKK